MPAARRPSSRGRRPPKSATSTATPRAVAVIAPRYTDERPWSASIRPTHERAAQRAALPEAVERQERERQEHGDLGVQVRQARPAVRPGREERSRHERRQPVAARAPHQELHREAREQQAAEERDVVGEDGAERPLQRSDDDRRQQQVLRERERVLAGDGRPARRRGRRDSRTSVGPAQARIHALRRPSGRSIGPVWTRSRTSGQLMTASSRA